MAQESKWEQIKHGQQEHRARQENLHEVGKQVEQAGDHIVNAWNRLRRGK